MALNESSEADVGWQISMPSEDEKMDQMDDDLDPEQISVSQRRSSHSVESGSEPTESCALDPSIEIVEKMGRVIARMEVVDPEVLRVAPAFCAFQHFARPLRIGCDGDFYYKSFKSQKISNFWSHSWHGGHWNKILTLLTFYNASAALVCGFLIAILMMILFCYRLLPSVDRAGAGDAHRWSNWCLCSGFVMTTLLTFLWRSQKKIFLDRLCISQKDDRLKAKAIFSLAGLLKKSDVMLILWDPTWTERLWCLFELAAFLRSKEMASAKQKLIVRPIFFGPISITLFVFSFSVGFPLTTVPFPDPVRDSTMGVIFVLGPALVTGLMVAYPTVMTLRIYFRDLDIMKKQLLAISFDGAKSSCCDKGHQTLRGTPMLCDRKVVKECVKRWFGSQEAFEETLRSEVLEILMVVLSEEVFTNRWILGATCPFLWAFMDLSASFSHAQFIPSRFWEHRPPAYLLEGLMIWLVAMPSVKHVLIMICKLSRSKGRSWFTEILKNWMVVFTIAFLLCIIIALYIVSRFLHHETFERSLIFSGGVLSFSIASRISGVAMKAMLK